MSINDCLRGLHGEGYLSRDEADAMAHLYESLVRHYGDPTRAKAEMVERLMRQAQHQERQALLADEARERVERFLLEYRNARGEQDPAKAMVALIEHNGLVPMPEGMSSVVGRGQAIMGLALGRMEEVLHEFRRTWITGRTRNTAALQNVVREAAGEGTGDAAAAALARSWLDVAESLRQRFNAAGGAIGELTGWFLPQIHDRRALIAATRERWIADITRGLDVERMRHPLTGNAMTDEDLAESLDFIWRNITTDGWHSREFSAQRRGLGAISNQRADHRFLHFKSADAWLEYQAAYGGGADPFAAMMSHVKGMSEDIAAMEILGPNPRAMLTYMQNFVTAQAALRTAGEAAIFPTQTEILGRSLEAGGSWLSTKDPEDYARAAVKLTDDMWDIQRGAVDAAVNQRVADVFGTVRNLNVASKLGGAALSAVTDLGFQQVARLFAGLPALRVYDQVVASFATGPKRDAVRAGLVLETAVNVLHQEARWAAGMHGPVWSRVLADRVIASTGLAAWTQAGRHAFGLAFMGELARRAGETFGDLPAALQQTFRRYGLSGADWDAMRASAGDLLRPADVSRSMEIRGRGGENVAERYLEMILQETEYAVPSGTLQAKARSFGGLRRGVPTNEFWRSAGQFKMFGISVALLQGQRIATEMITRGYLRGAGYAGALLITSTLYGALAMQLKEIAKGRDPRPMDEEKFWGGALLQGGGLGIYGDFLASEQNRIGGGLARTLAGPSADVVAGVLSLTSGNMAQWLQGEKTNAGRELVRFLGSNTPGGSNWYLRSAYERVVLDELQRLVDPEAHAAFRRKIGKQKKDFGNEFWWRPGETSPRRGPDLGAAVRGR
jgi:hypothetical protein